jgi:hypothetical protein
MTKLDIGAPGWRPTEVHPFADLFPLGDVDDLAERIKANGLLDAILIDERGVLIDGRTRLAACEIAGIEPRFEQINGADPDALIADKNMGRRDLTKGQRAMIGALSVSEPISGYRFVGGKGRKGGQSEAARRANVAQPTMLKAFLVRDYANDLVPHVVGSTMTLDAAYDIAQTRKREAEWRDDGAAQLRKVAPDLADRVKDGEINIDEARKLHEKARAELFQEQDSLLLGLWQLVTTAGTFHKSSALPKLPEWLAGEDGAEMAKRIEKFYPGGIPELQARMADVRAGVEAVEAIVSNLPSAKKGRKK